MCYMVCIRFMDLVILGDVKRPLVCRLSSFQMKAVSSRLEDAIDKLPSEFIRQPRGLNEFARYKVAECRTFLLHTALFALKDIVDKNVYEHSCFSRAVRILLHKFMQKTWKLVKVWGKFQEKMLGADLIL